MILLYYILILKMNGMLSERLRACKCLVLRRILRRPR